MLRQIQAAATIAMIYAQIKAIQQSDTDNTTKHNATNELLMKAEKIYKAVTADGKN